MIVIINSSLYKTVRNTLNKKAKGHFIAHFSIVEFGFYFAK